MTMTGTTGPLPKALRSLLETTVKTARDVAETAARAALEHLGVGEGKLPVHLTAEQAALRRRLRAHGRALGDGKRKDDAQSLTHLVWEVAYEHWHRMLFARFLAENNLLLWELGAPVTLDECEELAHDPATNSGSRSRWELAGKLAARMLPQIFKPRSPVFELAFAPEHQRELECLLAGLPTEVFKASDSLGWVYQFWQAKRKDEVNASEVRIGADELPAVTQLFTEPYMVDFLLHNSLGAWWAAQRLGADAPRSAGSEEELRQRVATHGIAFPFLRFVNTTSENGAKRWQPAAGNFEGWPKRLADFRLLDPCCGSGHFLIAAFLLLVPMRMASEGLTAKDAVDAVLRDNLHGLEIDPRCVEIAVFALALTAWRYPDEHGNPLGVRAEMPAPNVACCGLKVSAKPEDWEALVPVDAPNVALLRQELRLLHGAFAQAPLLGSLLDPARSLRNDLATPSFDTLRELLERALATEHPVAPWGEASELGDDAWELALTARGLLDAARVLDARYDLVVTNVPYLARGKQNDSLRNYCETHYREAKNDLANVFLERCLELARETASRTGAGVVQIVMPQNWLFLRSYKNQRELLLKRVQWNLLARLGPGAFETISGEVVQVILLSLARAPAEENCQLHGLEASTARLVQEKAAVLRDGAMVVVSQKRLLANPDANISFSELDSSGLFGAIAGCYQGTSTGDNPRFVQKFWEVKIGDEYLFFQGPADVTTCYSGRDSVVRWNAVQRFVGAAIRGEAAWNRNGVSIGQMRGLPATLYRGQVFSNSTPAVVPHDPTNLLAVWMFCSSPDFAEKLRALNQKLSVDNGYVGKIGFDLAYWQKVAADRLPSGLPKPYSDNPTQWLFHGYPQPATAPLQVAVARLAGYRWPAETDATIELADEARSWIARCETLDEHTDDDGIVCLPSVRGETAADERLLKLLIAAWETARPGSWKPALLDKLLAEADCAGKGLDVWLHDKFFEQHATLFHHHPFIWQIWDGLRDGFGALVNYRKLDNRKLERLIHTYLGDWIRTQEQGVKDGVNGAQTRLGAAQDLKRRLEAILEGETPYDIFVRWKPIEEQPIGWQPDLNDGVRLNIRPFITAGVLRHNKPPKLNIKWDKDRGKDVESAPWFKLFKGERINDHHLSLAQKRAARSRA